MAVCFFLNFYVESLRYSLVIRKVQVLTLYYLAKVYSSLIVCLCLLTSIFGCIRLAKFQCWVTPLILHPHSVMDSWKHFLELTKHQCSGVAPATINIHLLSRSLL